MHHAFCIKLNKFENIGDFYNLRLNYFINMLLIIPNISHACFKNLSADVDSDPVLDSVQIKELRGESLARFRRLIAQERREL